MQRVFDFLSKFKAKSVAIFSHIRGDGDALGAQTGLADILLSAGLHVALYNQDELSANYSFISRFDKISICTESCDLPDVCIAVDCASWERIGKLPAKFFECPWINIDHHISNENYAMLNIVEADASSTCEILARMAFNADIKLSPEASTSFYSGISADTGSFLYPNANATSFHVAAKLLDSGADKNKIQACVFENISKTRVRVLQYLYANIHYIFNETVAYCVFTKSTLQSLDASNLDLEGVVSLIKEIQGIELAILFTETTGNNCKISLRSRDWFDCNRFCSAFGGGGHIRASGATLNEQPAEAVNTVVTKLKDIWEEENVRA